jgi:N-ethylmaleimide reductase
LTHIDSIKNNMSILFNQIEVPGLGTLKNRSAMAAMTRGFADQNHGATEAMAEYYRRRAAGGIALILTEGVVIHQSADGYNSVPHIETIEQAETWKPVIDAVHSEGSKIVCQLWHCGRISHSDYTGGIPPVSSTNEAAEGVNRQNGKPFGIPVALDDDGIMQVYHYYLQAAKNALIVGFDGVQIHLGHGYLADQFFDARINTRSDRYGGSVENRCRFALELIEFLVAEIGSEKISVRVSPSRDMGGIYDWPDLEEMLAYFIPALDKSGVNLLDVSCARADYYQTSGRIIRMIRKNWPGRLMGGASLNRKQAEEELENGYLDVVTWGRHLIANPDLLERFAAELPLREFDIPMLRELE